jgi:hypothetical protein
MRHEIPFEPESSDRLKKHPMKIPAKLLSIYSNCHKVILSNILFGSGTRFPFPKFSRPDTGPVKIVGVHDLS